MKTRLSRLICARFYLVFALCILGSEQSFANDTEIIGGLGVESTSVFRGTKSTRLNPSPYGFFEISRGNFYGGIVASPVAIAGEKSALVVGYVARKQSVGPLDLEIGARRYAFPDTHIFEFDLDGDGVADHSGDKGLSEFLASLAYNFTGGKVTLRTFYSLDTFAETGQSVYVHADTRLNLPMEFEVRADAGVSRFEKTIFNDNYYDYGVALHRSAFGFDMFLRYSDTVGLSGPSNRAIVFGIERSLTIFSSSGSQAKRRDRLLRSHHIENSLLGLPR